MANRRSTFLLKRSNIAGKIPAAGDLQLGELALNIADNILYASGTTANSILPIGWDRVARTGDTMTGNFNFFGDVAISGSSLPNGYALSVTGDTNFSGDMYVGGNLYYDGNTIIQSGLTASTIYTDYIDFNTGYTGQTLPAGRLQWDDGNGTLVLGLKGGTSNMEIGLENMALCFNDEATTLTAGTVVYVSGSQGNRPSIKRAIATSDGYSVTTLGIVSESIASGAEGFVTTFGMVNNLNTIGYSGGTAIWLSPTVSGAFTSVKPQAPQHTVLLGYVVRVHASVGSIFVHISNGWEIDELHDVRLNNKVEGDLLAYSAYNGSNVWVNTKTLNGSYTITGNTNIGGGLTASTVSASTISGDNLYVTGGTQSIFSGNSSSDLVRITQTGSGNAFVVEDSNNPDSSSFVIDSVGNTGIGTTPSAKLHVSGNTIFGIGNDTSNYATTIICSNDGINPKGLFVTRGANLQGLHIHNQDGSQVNIDAIGFAAKPLNIRNRMAESLIFGTNDTERMRITSSGSVGIGTTTPSEKLEVSGNIKLLSTGSTKISIQSAAGVQTYLAADGAGTSFGSLSNHDVVFYRNNSEFARMSSIGFGIGTTTPAAKLDVNGIVKFNHNGTTNYTLFQNDNEINTYTSAGVAGSVYLQWVPGGITNIGHNNLIVNSNTTGSSIAGLTITSSSNVGLGTATPSAKFHVRSTAIPSTSENIARFDVSDDTNSYLRIYNGTSTDASFVPTLEGSNSQATVALALVGNGTTDTGNTAITIFDSRIGSAQAATRPLFQWNNYGTTQMSMRADGNLGIGLTNPTEKLQVSGNTIITGTLRATSISATTYLNLPTDVTVTGGTYTYGTATFTNNTGGTFSVTGMSTSGSNVGGGVGVFSGASGSTLVFKTLTSTASTITIQNNENTVNLETNAGVKVIPIATSSVSIGTGSNDYYLNFNAPYNMTIASITFSVSSNGSDNVRLAIYRGQDTTATLVGQSASSTVLTTLPTFTMTPESGQNLTFKAGEWMVIGVAVGGTTTNLYGSSCPATNSIAWTNTTDSTGGFPTNPRSKAGTRTSFPSIEINVV